MHFEKWLTLFRITGEKMRSGSNVIKIPKTAKALGFRPKAFMVAGAGFEPTTFGL